ncbi:LPXTG cell wall anchor domain-containing protein [Streptomyces macrosporus]|uniref:Gram-positive cocci surface proteins LPxTG domain-containing protein n=1 Tax=Streptomyces macrosporus TaxID=44032 RepID=A0ABN3KDI8_9ACTN
MRTLSSASVVTAAAALCLLSAPTAYAISPATPGDNGTVKVHDAVTDQEYDRRNNPKVCEFYLVGSGFDARQKITWKIVDKSAENKGTVVQKGALVLDLDGHGRTENITLDDGHYKLSWKFEGEKGRAKQKVFKVDCEDGTASPAPTGTDSPAPSGGPSTAPTGEPSGEPSASTPGEPSSGSSSEAPASPAPSDPADPADTPNGGGNLAETGSSAPVAALAAAAAALLGAGSYLIVRRRRDAQG